MPGLGASPFGYKIAEQFGLNVLPTRAGLVPFTLHKPLLEELQVLAGVAVPSVITAWRISCISAHPASISNSGKQAMAG